jgi:hypothetical protein
MLIQYKTAGDQAPGPFMMAREGHDMKCFNQTRSRLIGMHMLHLPIRALLLAAAVCAVPPAVAQQGVPAEKPLRALAPPVAEPPPTGAPSAIDPDAIAALEAMGAYLRTLQSFEVSARTTTENVMDDGFKLQFDSTADLKVRRPDRLRVDISNDRKQRQIFYDGKSVTVYGPRVKYYATVPAPPTLRETIGVLTKKYGIELPLADLFYWGTEEAPLADIKTARYIGPATVDGKPAEHYAFRQEGVDWQIWIQLGKRSLPLKLAITSTAQPGEPTYSAWLRWNLSPRFSETAFVFKPPSGAMKIVMQTADGQVVNIK